VPYNFFALKADTFPAMPSFLRAGICGQGTAYACPGQWVPIPHGKSLHITPTIPACPPRSVPARVCRERRSSHGRLAPTPIALKSAVTEPAGTLDPRVGDTELRHLPPP